MRNRRGAVAVLACVCMVILVGFFALAVDVGNICWTKAQLQAAADAAALAGAGTLYVQPDSLETPTYAFPYTATARATAQQYVRKNVAAQFGPPDELRPLRSALEIHAQKDIVVGRVIDSKTPLVPDEFFPNAVQVTVPLTKGSTSGPAGLLFGIFAKTHDIQAVATAKVQYPHLLPFTAYDGAWTGETISVFPGSWDGSDLPPGNFGALHIGPDGGGTTEMREQTADGVDGDDLAPFAGKIESGTQIRGETGIMAGMEDAFLGGHADGRDYPGIIGEARFLPLYSTVEGNGANATFTIQRFVAVKVVAVNLKGGKKYIKLAPVNSLNELVKLRLVR